MKIKLCGTIIEGFGNKRSGTHKARSNIRITNRMSEKVTPQARTTKSLIHSEPSKQDDRHRFRGIT
jgi:hypothetical protein